MFCDLSGGHSGVEFSVLVCIQSGRKLSSHPLSSEPFLTLFHKEEFEGFFSALTMFKSLPELHLSEE